MESENRILKGAEELFAQYGIKNVTMDEIARHLGMSKKTIYLHYTDKNKLVDEVVKHMIFDHDIECKSIESKSQNAIDEIFQVMNYMNAFFTQVNPNLFFDMQRYHPEAWLHFIRFKESVVLEQVIQNMEKGIKEGLYRKDYSIKILARLRVEEIELVMNPKFYPPTKYNLQEVQAQLLDHFLHGICTLKGHKLLNKYKQLHEEE